MAYLRGFLGWFYGLFMGYNVGCFMGILYVTIDLKN